MTPVRAAAAPQRRRVVVGIAGSIAAYKAPSIIRLLRSAGCDVKAVPTQAALNFIGAPALAAVSGGAISTGVFDDPAAVEHVATAAWADLVLVAPASADLVARVAAGRCDDLLTATILTTKAPVILAPAMHTQMWDNPATQSNIATLRRRGIHIIEPAVGALTSGDSGRGRLPEPEAIVAEALAYAGAPDGQDLVGKKIVITAGGTREPLDPVRFLGNRSSGRQGIALATQAAARGAEVTLIAANISPALLATLPTQVRVISAPTALTMAQAVTSRAQASDAVVMAAAVADYRPARTAATKIKKRGLHEAADEAGACESQPATLSLELVENPDILAGLVRERGQAARPVIVGFAAETGDAAATALEHGRAKARRKGADLLAVNVVGEHEGFGDVTNAITVLGPDGGELGAASGSKAEVAAALLDLIAARLA